MKLEAYPNRNSVDFMDKFGMKKCHTFVRGTLRFDGFSSIISAMHDLKLTTDEVAPDSLSSLKLVLASKISLLPVRQENN